MKQTYNSTTYNRKREINSETLFYVFIQQKTKKKRKSASTSLTNLRSEENQLRR